MGIPWSSRDNYLGYDKTDLMQNIYKIKDKEFLLVHGTADMKVNIQHSMLLMKALTEHNIPFRLQVIKFKKILFFFDEFLNYFIFFF